MLMYSANLLCGNTRKKEVRMGRGVLCTMQNKYKSFRNGLGL